MKKIQLRDAKAGLSSIVDAAAQGRPVVTRHGKPEAVILGFQDYRRLAQVPSFARLLMSAPAGVRDVPHRDRSGLRNDKL
jgi:antitoxin Phd